MLNTPLYQATICAWEAKGAQPEHAAIKLCFPANQKGRKLIEAYCKPAQIPYKAINVVGEHANAKYFEVYFSPDLVNTTLQLNSLKEDQEILSDPDKIVNLPIASLAPGNGDSIQFGLDLENMLKAMHDLAIFPEIPVQYTNNRLATILNILRKGEGDLAIRKDAISHKQTETPALINTHEFADLINKQTSSNIYKSALEIQHSFIKRSDLKAIFKPLYSYTQFKTPESFKKIINKLRQIKLFFQEKTMSFLNLIKQKNKSPVGSTVPRTRGNQQMVSLLRNPLKTPIKTPKIFTEKLPTPADLSKVTVCLYGKSGNNQYDSASLTLCFPADHKITDLQQKYLKNLPHVMTDKTCMSPITKKLVKKKYYEVYFMVEQVNDNMFLCSAKEKTAKKPDMIIDLPLRIHTKDAKQDGLDIEHILQKITTIKPRPANFFKYTKGNVVSMMIDILNTQIISPTQKMVARLLHNQRGN